MNWKMYNYIRFTLKLSRGYAYHVGMTSDSIGLLPRAVKFIRTLKNTTTC